MKKQTVQIVSNGMATSTEVYLNGKRLENVIAVDVLPITADSMLVEADITIRATEVILGGDIPSDSGGFASDKFDGSFGK